VNPQKCQYFLVFSQRLRLITWLHFLEDRPVQLPS
jgi:hypothetical protein